MKSIKFKTPILDVLANKRSIVVSFAERLAVFDACALEDRLTVTTCYPAPCPFGGPVPTPCNPVALGDRWLAYAERRLSPTKRSNGGCEGRKLKILQPVINKFAVNSVAIVLPKQNTSTYYPE